MRTTSFAFSLTTTTTLALALALSACASPESEYIRALPDRATVMVDIPEGSSARGLAPNTRTAERAIVGEPADLYTSSYYSARNLNGVVGFMVTLLETITSYPPTGIDDEHAVWGPFSDPREPNEFVLNVVKKSGETVHYEWFIAGKHKSEGVDAFRAIAGGAFAPEGEDYGRGWFGIDFDVIGELNPSEDGRGKIGFAFARTAEGTAVLAHYEGPDQNAGDGMDIAASYAYGEDNAGNGFIVFAFPGDIDDGKDGRTAKEDVLIRTRWNTNGGRADILAANGDLGAELAQGSQCWDETFISTFESITVGDRFLASSGEASTCVFDAAKLPEQDELPAAGDVANPYEAE